MPVFSSKIFRRANGTSHDQEYPVDEYGAEMGENARVWRAYLDEADEYDFEMVEGFRDTTDVLLVFAGLFSAAVSAFVTLSSQALQPDYGQITAALMTELVNLQRAVASGGNVSQIPPSSLSFTNDNTTEFVDRWVNGLWLTSLTLSLVTALVAVLAKQWLIHYVSALSGTPRRRVLVRHFRFIGLEKWRVSTIIAALPVILHTSLFMFLAGLVIFVWRQDLSIAAVILAITSLTFTFYLYSNILAAFVPDCSYKTPVSTFFNYLRLPLILAPRRGTQTLTFCHEAMQSHRDMEIKAADANHDSMLLRALSWLHSSSYNPRNIDLVRFAFAGLPFGFGLGVDPDLRKGITAKFWSLLNNNNEVEVTPCTHSDFTLRSALIFGFGNDLPRAFELCTAHIAKEYQTVMSPHRPSYPNALIGLIYNVAFLPPALWSAIFTQNLYQLSGIIRDTDQPVRRHLITALLPILKLAPNDVSRKQTFGTNWTLPPSVSLIQLCNADHRMFRILLDFVCQALLPYWWERRIRTILDNTRDPLDSPILLQITLFIIDSLHKEIAEGGTEDYAGDLLSACEDTLFSSRSIPPDSWCEPAFATALHRCQEVRSLLRDDHGSSRFVHYLPSQNASLAVIMQYLLDVLQHPWPVARESDFPDLHSALTLMKNLFRARDQEAFQCFLKNAGLAVFRRCFPVDFNLLLYFGFGQCWFDYVSFVSSHHLGDEERQGHLDMMMQPENLAWLLSIASLHHRNLIQMLYPLLPDPNHWTAAGDVLVEGLRRDSAARWGRFPEFTYKAVARALCDVRLDHHVLYGYVSSAEDVPRDFRRFLEDGVSADDVMYGPFAVYTTTEVLSGW